MQQREAEGGRTAAVGAVAAVHEKENINIQYKIGFNGRGKVVEKIEFRLANMYFVSTCIRNTLEILAASLNDLCISMKS